MTIAASRMFTITHGEWSARVSSLGAALADLSRSGVSVLAHPQEVEPASGYHGAVLAPWPGRVPFGRYSFEGQDYQLDISEPAYGHALHGLVAGREWQTVAHSDDAVTLVRVITSEPGYPFTVEVAVTYQVTPDGFRCTARWRNRSERPAPFGIGFHPYFALGNGVDSMILELPANVSIDSNVDTKIPMPARATDARDFSEPRQIGPTTFARCYGGLPRHRGWVHAILTEPGRRGIRISGDETFGWFQVYTGDLAREDLYRRGFALEPQTCPPGAFVSGQDAIVLAPGQTGGGVWTVETA